MPDVTPEEQAATRSEAEAAARKEAQGVPVNVRTDPVEGPEQLAFQLWFNKLLVGHPDLQERIARAATLTEAIKIAKEENIKVESLSNWSAVEDQLKRETFESTDPDFEGIEVGGYLGEDRKFNDMTVEALQEISDARDINADADSEGRLLPPGFTVNDFGAYRDRVTGNDNYSPWGYGPQNARERMSDLYVKGSEAQRTSYGNERDNFGVDWYRIDDDTAADRAYWKTQTEAPDYIPGDEVFTWTQLSPRSKARMERRWEESGRLNVSDDGTRGYIPGASMGRAQIALLQEDMGWGNAFGVGYEIASGEIRKQAIAEQRFAAANASGPSGPGRGRAPRASFTIPGALREIPDYESIEQETTNMFRQVMGRDMEDWEMSILADQMQQRYKDRNAEKIKAAKAAFYQAQGGAVGSREVEVSNPQLRTQKFMEDRYANELDLSERSEDMARTNQMLINSITKGVGMVR